MKNRGPEQLRFDALIKNLKLVKERIKNFNSLLEDVDENAMVYSILSDCAEEISFAIKEAPKALKEAKRDIKKRLKS